MYQECADNILTNNLEFLLVCDHRHFLSPEECTLFVNNLELFKHDPEYFPAQLTTTNKSCFHQQ